MSESVNPYIAGSPVTGTEMFFGRDDVFAFVRQTLTGKHQDNVIVLYGQRRTGKTSVLYQMHRHLDPRYIPIFLDLHGLALDGLGGFLWELANIIQRALRREYKLELPRLNRAEFFGDPRVAFENDFLNQVWAAIGERHLLLMLDEAIRLQEQVQAGKLEKQVFEYLRHLMQHHPRLNFLFSLGSGLEEMEKEYAFLFSVGLYKKISFLDRDSAIALITQPVREQYELEPAAIEHILQITSGHAYYTQLLCHSIFNRWQREQKAPVHIADVDASLDEVIERGLAVLKHVWEESSPTQKVILAGLAAAQGDMNRTVAVPEIALAWESLGVSIPPGEMAKALKTLIARDVLIGDNQYRFAVDLQRRYVRKYERLEWVKEETNDTWREWAALAAAPRVSQTSIPAPARPRKWNGRTLALSAAVAAILLCAGLALYLFNLDTSPFRVSVRETQVIGRGTLPTPTQAVQAEAPTSAPNRTPSATALTRAIFTNTDETFDLILRNGEAWAATNGGLVRWHEDGTYRVFTTADGLPFNEMRALRSASDGGLWLAGRDRNVALVHPEGDSLGEITVFDSDKDLGIGYVRTFMVDEDGSLWAGGSYGNGISRFDGTRWTVPANITLDVPALGGSPTDIMSMLRSSDGTLWLGLETRGILRWDGTEWTRFSDDQGVGDKSVYRLYESDDGTLFAGTSGGLLRFDAANNSWTSLPTPGKDAPVYDITQFEDKTLWIAQPQLVAQSRDGAATWRVVGNADDGLTYAIARVVQSNPQRVWVGTNSGLTLYDNGTWRHPPLEPSIPSSEIGTLGLTSDNWLWMLQRYGNVVGFLNPSTGEVGFPFDPDSPLKAIAQDVNALAFSSDVIWAGTDEGLKAISVNGMRRWTQADGLPSDVVYSLLASPQVVGIGTDKGLAYLELNTGKIQTVQEFAGSPVRVLYAAPNGDGWVGTADETELSQVAVGYFDGATWHIWRTGEGPLVDGNRTVGGFSADTLGNIWLALMEGGVWRWDGKTWRRFTQEDGAPGNHAYAVAAHAGEIWFGGPFEGRLYRWSEAGWSNRRVNELTGSVYAMQTTPDGAMWLGTDDGLVRYAPE